MRTAWAGRARLFFGFLTEGKPLRGSLSLREVLKIRKNSEVAKSQRSEQGIFNFISHFYLFN
jgi:hypothetical protein